MKDRVMSDEQLEAVEEAYLAEEFSVNSIRLLRGHTEDLRKRVAEAQDKISFRAGVNEVVEFLKLDKVKPLADNRDPSEVVIKITIGWEEWQAQLKEWGISNGK